MCVCVCMVVLGGGMTVWFGKEGGGGGGGVGRGGAEGASIYCIIKVLCL